MKKSILIPLILIPATIAAINIAPKEPENEVEAIYSPYQIPNGGFETGDLTGWKVFRLWKDENGMAAFDSSLVHNGTYFSSNPYGRDGNYQLGITSGSITWDQSSERMGYLRSSNFVLGGSGWISFKLGGGNADSFAYMSVRKVSDDTEVARFANKNYNNTTIATTQYGSSITNAEAFLFQYYYDMTNVVSLGENLYILLCDTSAYDWSILSADSFVTYIASAPSPNSDQTATNILPSIQGIDTADNSIKNGYFNTDLSDWAVSNDTATGWYYSSSHYAKSNQGGDASLGVLRSSAFIVTTNKYIRFDWAGGLRYDKQIFISVKEVGTNIEKIRFVRRDNLSTKESEGFDNHMLNLSSLDGAKKYYLEFADGRSGGWGISYVDAVRTVPESEWNSVTSGDRAVLISNLPLTFTVNEVQEASSYGAYFIQETAAQCAALQGDQVPWSTLATEYATLSAAAKDYFVAGGTTEANVVAARTRYVFLWNKYKATPGWTNFLVSSTGTKYTADANQEAITTPIDSSIATLFIFASALIVSAGLVFIYRRKRA